jgi:hypothetical protein
MTRRRATTVTRVLLVWTLGVLAVGLFVLGRAAPAAACSCAARSDEEAFASADAVFTGTLVEIRTPAGEQWSSADPERFVFDVDEVLKGEVFARQSVVTAREGASCGLEIGGPGPFVVFARTASDGVTSGAVDGELYSNLCSGTRLLTDGALPAGVAAGTVPRPGASAIGDGDGDGSSGARVAVGVAALAAVAAAVAYGSRRLLRTRRPAG